MDAQQYNDGAKKMVREGLEVVDLIKTYVKTNQKMLDSLGPKERKHHMVNADQKFALFHQIHPIVFQYLTVEGIFNSRAFDRYVHAVFGTPRPLEIQEKMTKDKSYVFYYKNEQQALYYKYLILETNPHLSTQQAHTAYMEVVTSMNNEITKLLDAYKEAEKKNEQMQQLTAEEKRKEIIDLLRKKVTDSEQV